MSFKVFRKGDTIYSMFVLYTIAPQKLLNHENLFSETLKEDFFENRLRLLFLALRSTIFVENILHANLSHFWRQVGDYALVKYILLYCMRPKSCILLTRNKVAKIVLLKKVAFLVERISSNVFKVYMIFLFLLTNQTEH